MTSDPDRDNLLADQYDPGAVEDTINKLWDEHNAYELARDSEAMPDFYLLDGPPFTSGQMHLGTAWNKTLKDTAIRYLRMQGHVVNDQPGYDMHGLPIETKVEEKLNFTTKKEIREFGIEKFTEECRTFATENLEKMNEDFQSLGVWMDWENPYRTMSNDHIQGVWWGFKQAYNRGLVEKGRRVVSQCPRCETAIADNEVEYDEVSSPSIYVKFPLKDEDASLIIWTTTPWTIPANLYIAVDEDAEYARVRADNGVDSEEIIVAHASVEEVVKKGRYDDYEILETFPGESLVDKQYRHPIREQVPKQNDYHKLDGHHQVHATDFVDVDRTGLVHAAPGHGMEDSEYAQEAGLEIFSPISIDGVYTDDGGKYSGKFVRDANDEIIDDLAAADALVFSGQTEHRYGHCWRCDTPVISVATDQWYITVTDIIDQLLDELDRSKWHPEWARDRRQRDWIENANDWCVSRQRYWGTPIPIWEADDGDQMVFGTIDELAEHADQDIDSDEIDLHRPEVDDITITKDGKTYTRVPDVFDVWVDSGCNSWASLGYPMKSERFDEMWPADLIIEAHDQTRGWFWSQLGMGTVAFDEIPYREVIMHGHALDENGLKMSKSRGNIVTPQEAIDRYGADPVRAFLLTRNLRGEDMRFSWDEIRECKRNLNVIWNVFRFPLPYMRMDNFDPQSAAVEDEELTVLDKWILSRMESTKQTVTSHMEEFEMPETLSTLISFLLEDVSRYYVQSIRDRVWTDAETEDKEAAYATLHHLLEESARLLAPYVPHISERLYQVIDGNETTIHALDWPEPREDLHDPNLEDEISVVRDVEEAVLQARDRGGISLRWPVQRIVVSTDSDQIVDSIESHTRIMSERVNSRNIETVEGSWEELDLRVEPQMDALGPAFGNDAPSIADAMREADPGNLSDSMTLSVDGTSYDLDEKMFEFIEEPPEYTSAAEFEQGTVYVDTTQTEDLLSEGYAREIIRRIQEMRKDLDLEITQQIEALVVLPNKEVADMVKPHNSLIGEETRAVNLEFSTDSSDANDPDSELDLVKSWEIRDVTVTIGISPF